MKQALKKLTPPIIWQALFRIRYNSAPTLHTLEIPINQCVHLSGFRYGVNEFNHYESYLIDLKNKVPILTFRKRFIEYLMYYRPRHLGEALALNSLSKEYPLWIYPWQQFEPKKLAARKGWFATPNECTDVQTHFCEQGILSFRIEDEFSRLERILYSISVNGYQPDLYKSYVRVLQFYRSDGKRTYLLLEGNHRVSAMSALGYKIVKVQQASTHIICERDCDQWYGVKQGFFSREDALQIFNAYFEGNRNYRTTIKPARIIAPDDWLKIYKLDI